MTDIKSVNAVKNSPPVKAADAVLIALLAVAAIIFSVFGLFTGQKGDNVRIDANGKTYVYSLSENREIVLDSLTVVIENGKVYVKDANCSDKICEHTGKIDKVNQSIVCLPGNVVIVIEGEGDFQVDTGQEK